MAVQCIVRSNSGCSAGSLADADGDGLAVGQCHDHRRASNWRTDGGGVSHGAAFSHRSIGGQFYRRGIDGVGDLGDRRRSARNEVLEVTTGGTGDRRLHRAGVFVDIVGRCRNSCGAGGFASLDGDHGTVRQGHDHWRASGVGQCSGVNNRTTFGHRTGRTQRKVGGVGNVGDRSRDRSFIRNQIFEVATGHASDRVGDRRIAGQRIVRSNSGCGASSLTDADGDGLTVGQSYHNRRTSHWRTNGGGVSHGSAFSHRSISRQFDGQSIDGVGDLGDRRRSARNEVLEVTAGSAGDRRLHGTSIFVDVIGRCRNGCGAGCFASLDGDHSTVRQGHGHGRASGVGQCRGVRNLATFSHRIAGAERQIGGVVNIRNSGRNWSFVCNQIFEIAASYASDRVGDRSVAGQRIVRSNSGCGASSLTDADGDGLTVGQSYHNRRTSNWRTNGGGVSHGAAFSHRSVGRQFDRRSVDGVGDSRHRWSSARYEVLEIATGSASDRCLDGTGVFINVIGWRRNGRGAAGFTSLDDDHCTVRQSHGHW